jgi:hypothetical protein
MDAGDLIVRNIRSARELVIASFGVLATTKPHETDYTISTTAVQIGTNIFQRTGLNLSNTGNVTIAIGFKTGVTITTGILLQPGGFLSMTWFYDLELVTRQLWAIAAAAGATLHMIENVIDGA